MSLKKSVFYKTKIVVNCLKKIKTTESSKKSDICKYVTFMLYTKYDFVIALY